MEKDRPASRTSNIVEHDLESELLIYDLVAGKAFCLNETSARVWRACDGVRTVDEITALVGSDEVVWIALDQLREESLLENAPMTPARFVGMTRRQMIARAGFASMVALPLITSLLVPQSIYAQTSCVPTGSPCTTSAQCCPNNQGIGCCRAGVCSNGGGGCA